MRYFIDEPAVKNTDLQALLTALDRDTRGKETNTLLLALADLHEENDRPERAWAWRWLQERQHKPTATRYYRGDTHWQWRLPKSMNETWAYCSGDQMVEVFLRNHRSGPMSELPLEFLRKEMTATDEHMLYGKSMDRLIGEVHTPVMLFTTRSYAFLAAVKGLVALKQGVGKGVFINPRNTPPTTEKTPENVGT